MDIIEILSNSIWGQLAAIVSIIAAIFGVLKFISSLTVPRSAEFVSECIDVLRRVRTSLNSRPQIVDPIGGGRLIRDPESVEELLAIRDLLTARHEYNRSVYREIRHVLYPTQRRGLKRSLDHAARTRSKYFKVLDKARKATERNDGKLSDGAFQRVIKMLEKVWNGTMNFERKLLKAIDKSLELWSKRIG